MNISQIGKFALLDKINAKFKAQQKTTVTAFGNDASVIGTTKKLKQICSGIFLEGINFNLVYTPLKHLGYKAVTHAISNLVATNSTPQQIIVSVGVSSRFKVSDIEMLYDGINSACNAYNVDMVGNDITASLTGMVISITAVGEANKDEICCRSGAKPNDLVCISGDIGAAYMGLQVLERERRIYETNTQMQPQLIGYDYILQRQLKPLARTDMTAVFNDNNIIPTSMTDITDGLASDILHICKESGTGVRIYLDKIPISSETFKICEEMNFDAVTAALNGGDDFELLFTIPLSEHEKVKNLAGFEVIGHITEPSKGAYLVTPDGSEIKIKAQGWTFESE